MSKSNPKFNYPHSQKKIDRVFESLLAIGEKIETLTRQIKTEIDYQEDKTEPVFLQKLKPKVNKLAQFYQEELRCVDIIKRNEADISDNTHASPSPLVPLFILEEKTWKKLGLVNPWEELNLHHHTLLELAIEHEIEQHGIATINAEETQLKQQIAAWQKELSLLGVSVQYKANTKFNPHKFDQLLNTFVTEHQSIDNELELVFDCSKLASSTSTKTGSDINVTQAIKNTETELIDSQTVDNFLREMADFSQNLDDIAEIIIPHQGVKPVEINEKEQPLPGKVVTDIDLSSVDQEIAELLNQKPNSHNTKSASSYLKRFFTVPLTIDSITKSNKKAVVIDTSVKIQTDIKPHLLKLDNEIDDYIKKMDIVIKGSSACDMRLCEYLRIRIKHLASLLLEKDFLLQHHSLENKEALEHYIHENLTEKKISLLTELLEPIKETLIENIAKENQEIKLYNKNHKKNRPIKVLNEYDWKMFVKKLLE